MFILPCDICSAGRSLDAIVYAFERDVAPAVGRCCDPPLPSAEALAFTRRMAEAREIVGVRLLGHIVVGEAPALVSLRQRIGW